MSSAAGTSTWGIRKYPELPAGTGDPGNVPTETIPSVAEVGTTPWDSVCSLPEMFPFNPPKVVACQSLCWLQK